MKETEYGIIIIRGIYCRLEVLYVPPYNLNVMQLEAKSRSPTEELMES